MDIGLFLAIAVSAYTGGGVGYLASRLLCAPELRPQFLLRHLDENISAPISKTAAALALMGLYVRIAALWPSDLYRDIECLFMRWQRLRASERLTRAVDRVEEDLFVCADYEQRRRLIDYYENYGQRCGHPDDEITRSVERWLRRRARRLRRLDARLRGEPPRWVRVLESLS